MPQARPKLIVFGLSHFCEHGITYSEISWAPGLHRVLLKRHGAKGSALPVLLDGETIVQGSGAIIDWAESKAQDPTRSLKPQTGNLAEAQEIERRADEVIGIHVRRLAYAELLRILVAEINKVLLAEATLGINAASSDPPARQNHCAENTRKCVFTQPGSLADTESASARCPLHLRKAHIARHRWA
jgi:hypothetical protein